MGHIGILVVAVRRLSHSPMGIRTSKLLFFKLPRLKLPSSSRSYTEQYHTKLIRLSEACPRIPGGYPFIYRLVLARGYPRLAMFFYTVWSPPEAIHGWLCFSIPFGPRPRLSTVWWLCFSIPFGPRPRLSTVSRLCFYIPFGPRPGLSTVSIWIHRYPRFEGIHPRLNLIPPG